jgi:phage repressor protein C with HTH and peptisase S24 domain
MTLVEKLKEAEQRGIKYTDIAQATKIPVKSLYQWKNGTKPSDSAKKERLNKYLNEILGLTDELSAITEEIVTPTKERRIRKEGKVLESIMEYKNNINPSSKIKESLVAIDLASLEKPVLYKDGKADDGDLVLINEKIYLIAFPNDSSLYGDVDGLITVLIDNLEPHIKKGSLVSVKREFTNMETYWQGKYYLVIDKSFNKYFKQIKREKDGSLTLKADKSTDQDIQLSREEILICFRLVQMISDL